MCSSDLLESTVRTHAVEAFRKVGTAGRAGRILAGDRVESRVGRRPGILNGSLDGLLGRAEVGRPYEQKVTTVLDQHARRQPHVGKRRHAGLEFVERPEDSRGDQTGNREVVEGGSPVRRSASGGIWLGPKSLFLQGQPDPAIGTEGDLGAKFIAARRTEPNQRHSGRLATFLGEGAPAVA